MNQTQERSTNIALALWETNSKDRINERMTPEDDARSVMSVVERAKLTPIESIKKMLQYTAAFIVVIEDRLLTLDCSSPEIQQNISQAYSGFALVQKCVEAIKDELEHTAGPRFN